MSSDDPFATMDSNNNNNHSNSSADEDSEDGSEGGGNLYQVPASVVLLLSLFYGLISLTALVGNGLVIYVVAVSRRMRTVTNFYICNLAFADVTIALFAIPFQFHAALLQRWDLPEFMCQFCPTVQTCSVNVSIFTLVAISLDRYRAIMHPLRRKPSKCISKLIIVLIWLFSLAFALPMGLVHTFGYVPDGSSDNNNNNSDSDSNNELLSLKEKPFCYIDFGPNATDVTMFKSYTFSLVTVEYFVPLAIISFAYAQIAVRLWGSKTPGVAQDDRDYIILQNKKKVIKMLVIVVSIFAVCWLPWQTYMAAMLISPQINDYRYINIIFFISHWLAMSNSCYNPFIYGVYSEKFRHEFSARIPCLRRILGSPETTGVAGAGTAGGGGGGLTDAKSSAANSYNGGTTKRYMVVSVGGSPRRNNKLSGGDSCLTPTTAVSSTAAMTSSDLELNEGNNRSGGGGGKTYIIKRQQQQQQQQFAGKPYLDAVACSAGASSPSSSAAADRDESALLTRARADVHNREDVSFG